jgi:hypothetical protein
MNREHRQHGGKATACASGNDSVGAIELFAPLWVLLKLAHC